MVTNFELTASTEKNSLSSICETKERNSQLERLASFADTLKKLKEMKKQFDEADAQRKKIMAQERKETNNREKRISELRGLIARYRHIAMGGGDDANAAAAIVSQLESELFWILFGLG